MFPEYNNRAALIIMIDCRYYVSNEIFIHIYALIESPHHYDFIMEKLIMT